MAQTYPKTFKNCSTCDSWLGQREISTDGSSYKVNSASAKGKCKHQKDIDKLAFMSCPLWA